MGGWPRSDNITANWSWGLAELGKIYVQIYQIQIHGQNQDWVYLTNDTLGIIISIPRQYPGRQPLVHTKGNPCVVTLGFRLRRLID